MPPNARDRLAAKGKRVPLSGLIAQAGCAAELIDMHREELAAVGFPVALREAINEQHFKLSRLVDQRIGANTDSLGAREVEVRSLAEAKAHIFRLRKLVPMIVRNRPLSDVPADAFTGSGTLRRSTPKILCFLISTRVAVAALEEELKPYFRGESPLAIHDRLTNALAAADSAQENKRESLPKETKDVYETKGALLELIEDMNRIGQVLFMDRPEMAARFNKKLIARGRRRRTKAETSDVQPGPSEPGDLK